MKKARLIFFLLLFTAALKAQDTFILKGQISDHDTKENVFAEIALVIDDSVYQTTHADLDGSFILNPVTCTNCQLKISANGYKKKMIALRFSEKWLVLNGIELERVKE